MADDLENSGRIQPTAEHISLNINDARSIHDALPTAEQKEAKCPICYHLYKDLQKHLERQHHIAKPSPTQSVEDELEQLVNDMLHCQAMIDFGNANWHDYADKLVDLRVRFRDSRAKEKHTYAAILTTCGCGHAQSSHESADHSCLRCADCYGYWPC